MGRVKVHIPCGQPLDECGCPPDDDDLEPEDDGPDEAA